MKKFVLLVFIFLLMMTETYTKDPLRFNPNGKFKIVQFTDMHFGEDVVSDNKTMKQQRDILEWEKPDLVVVTGDSVTGCAYPKDNTCLKNGVGGCWKYTVQAMLDAHIPWAYIFGNHDDQGDLSRSQIMDIEQSFPLSLTQRGPANISGMTNYVLTLLSGKSNEPVVNLYMMDSSDDRCLGVSGWGCIYPNQVQWYRETAIRLKQQFNKALPAIAFFHIALQEYMNVWNKFPAHGHKEEPVCCSSVNTGIFSAFREMGDVISVHVGHDHDNDYYASYHNITLSYGRKTGFGGYFHNKFLRGARVLELTEQPFSIKTWIRQEDGSVDLQPENPSKHITDPQYFCGNSIG
jgi:hypothetical protein